MTNTDLLLRLWAQNYGMATRAIGALTEENRHHRLTADSASAGFLLQHIGEAAHRILTVTNGVPQPEGTEFFTVGGVRDEGQAAGPSRILEIYDAGYEAVRAYLAGLTDEQLDEVVETARWGAMTRAETFGVMMYHAGYHIGQAMLAIKRGQRF